MAEEVRAMTVVTYDDFVDIDEIDSNLKGICVSIWRRLADDLGLVDSLIPKSEWPDLLAIFEHNATDVIVQRVDEVLLEFNNITK